MRKTTSLMFTVLGLGLGAWAVQARGQSPASPSSARAAAAIDTRWKDSLDAFAAADKLQAPATGGILFVGSSSIRLWSDLEQAFAMPPRTVLKRGFGGSRMLDCAQHVSQLVLPYQPRLVVVYAGDNDLAEGRTPQQVLQSFTTFVDTVRQALPGTRIAYLSIKPSPLRANLIDAARETNALIEAYSDSVPNLDYIDVFSRMLDAQGRPRADLFLPDALHLNDAGYALWRTVIGPHLQLPAGPGSPSELQPGEPSTTAAR
ncbi:SGNH/GDSL hydrolase family protein [Aquincola sp. MAHUQ-54]|uniref:SGNH/GDSL hydrolase family protein n=1 Tax=Aquincola agrisoli TaxID=3119538 RepID=A0AAW9QAL6_9BURK